MTKHYTVSARRWFDKVYGNTYHSLYVFKNGKEIGSESFDYGYGSHYEQCALEIIKKDNPNIEVYALWQIKELGCTLINIVTEVQRRKDL